MAFNKKQLINDANHMEYIKDFIDSSDDKTETLVKFIDWIAEALYDTLNYIIENGEFND